MAFLPNLPGPRFRVVFDECALFPNTALPMIEERRGMTTTWQSGNQLSRGSPVARVLLRQAGIAGNGWSFQRPASLR